MRKYIAVCLIFCLVIPLLPQAFCFAEAAGMGTNISTVGPDEMPDSDIFEDTSGTMFNREAYAQWLVEGTPEVLVLNMLQGNVAFVVNSRWCWNLTQREEMRSAPVYNESGEMVIPTETINRLFNVSLSGEYAGGQQIADVLKTWEVFTDPRGFMIFSQDIGSVIDTAPAIEGNIAYRHYRSYYNVQAAIAKITWNDINPTKEDWEYARRRAYLALTLPEGEVGEYEDRYIRELAATVSPYLDTVTLGEDVTVPFSDCTLYTSFQRIVEMARLYAILRDKGRTDVDPERLKTAALGVFNFLADRWIGRNVSMDSNWFYNRITYPLAMAEFMILMYDEMEYARICEVTADLMVRVGSNLVSTGQVPFQYYTDGTPGEPTNSYSNYTNLLWQTGTNYFVFLLAENAPRMNDALKYAAGIFEQVRNSADDGVSMIKDGVYEDGSFVFHGWYPYNVGYGYSYIGVLGPLAALTAGTPFDIQNINGFSNVYQWIEKSWMPFIYANARIKITAGREKAQGLSGKGNVMVKGLLMLAKYARDAEGKATIERLLKPLVDEYYNDYIAYERIPILYYYTHATVNPEIRPLLDQIKAAPAAEEVEPYNYAYYNMDKFVHKRDNYTFMLSLSSERIDKYEAINNEGYTDWYIADGMTYLLMDSEQYIIDWWGSVDRYAIPGTTVDSSERNPYGSSYATIRPNNAWAGGASDGMIAVAAMQLPSVATGKTSYVDGMKSYFMLDDKIVCMGTGISGGQGEVYTTVENYESRDAAPADAEAVREDGYTPVTVDGQEVPYVFDSKLSYQNPQYISLNNDRGWVFFGNNDVTVERVVQNKRYAGLDKTPTESAYDVPFVTVKIEHGESPQNETYGYVIMPNKTEAELAEYAGNLDFEVLEQTDARHVIQLYDGTIMANLFEPGTLEGIQFKNPCSVILKPAGRGWSIYIAEPTQRLTTLMIEVPEGAAITGQDVRMNGNIAYVSVGRAYGDTYMLSYTTDPSGELWSAESESASQSGAIWTWNLKLRIGIAPVSTKLYAKSPTGAALTYRVANTEEIKGKTYIKEDRLYYIPPASYAAEDQILIEVADSDGNTASYTVSISMDQ